MEKKFTIAPFDLEKAKSGQPVCTIDGRDARIICYNAKSNYPIIALVIEDGRELARGYTTKGLFYDTIPIHSDNLMMKVEVKESSVFAEVAGDVMPFEEVKSSGCVDLKSREYLIIKTHNGKFLKIWKRNLPAEEFEAAQRAAEQKGEGWRCPTRHECIDIYDARFKGLDEAMNEIGGDDFKKCYWTCEADSDPQYTSNGAVSFGGYAGNLGNDYKYNKYSVRPVLAFGIEDNSVIE